MSITDSTQKSTHSFAFASSLVYPCARPLARGAQGYTREEAKLPAQRTKLVIGRGSREEISPGVYRVRFNLGRDLVTGKYAYSPWRTIHTTSVTKKAQLREVDEFAAEYKRELNEKGVVQAPATMTVGRFLDTYHKNRFGSVRPSTYRREAQRIKKTKSMLGRHRLSEISPSVLRAVYAHALANEAITASEVYEVNKLLRKAFKQGVYDGVMGTNPADGVKVSQPQYKQKAVLTAEQAATFKAKLLELPLGPYPIATLILLETGCRRGEALGLQWKNVLLSEGKIVICQQLTGDLDLAAPKSATSNRVVSISKSTAELRGRWQEMQKAQFAEKRVRWSDEAFVAHAFTVVTVEMDGEEVKVPAATFIAPHNLGRWFKDFCADNGFGRYTKNVREIQFAGKTLHRGTAYEGLLPHSLRHTQSTLLIGNGVDVKTVQARLGHSSPSLTLKQYTRALSKNDEAASVLFDELLKSSAV